jgi:hypothetical protein
MTHSHDEDFFCLTIRFFVGINTARLKGAQGVVRNNDVGRAENFKTR